MQSEHGVYNIIRHFQVYQHPIYEFQSQYDPTNFGGLMQAVYPRDYIIIADIVLSNWRSYSSAILVQYMVFLGRLLRPYKIPRPRKRFDEIFGGIGTVPALLTTKQTNFEKLNLVMNIIT